jgi:replication factor C subunit 2/4
MDTKNQLFSNKYQPTYFNDYKENEVVNVLKSLLGVDQINILLNGDVSSGKSTILKTIVKEYYKDYKESDYLENIMYINSIKEQGINYYRNEVKTFCQTCSIIKNKKKIIVIDDIDFINEQSQQVFRNCIDKYKHNVYFICSCTNIHKVIENLQSRLVIIKIKPLSKEVYTDIIHKIKSTENIVMEYDVEDFIISISNNNIKNIVNNMEKFKLYGKKISMDVAMTLCFNISFILLEKYTQLMMSNDLENALSLIYSIYDKGYSVIDILDTYFTFVKKTVILTEEQKYNIIPYICKYITMFYNIHEDEIELALFTNNLCSLLQNNDDK